MVYCAYVKKNVFCKSEFEEEIMMIAILGASTFSVVIILSILLICGLPLGEHDIMLPLAVTAGFIALGQDKRKER